MDLISTDRYSINNIVDTMKGSLSKESSVNNIELLPKKYSAKNKLLFIGGGNSILDHQRAISQFLDQNKDILVVYSTTRHINLLRRSSNEKFLCLFESKGNMFSHISKYELDTINNFIYNKFGYNSIRLNYNFNLVKDRVFLLGQAPLLDSELVSPLAQCLNLAKYLNLERVILAGLMVMISIVASIKTIYYIKKHKVSLMTLIVKRFLVSPRLLIRI